MAESNSILKRVSTFREKDVDISKKLIKPVRVVDIILDIGHPEANKHGGYDAIGTIFYAEVYNKEGADFPKNLRTARPMFQFIKQYPLKNEIVTIIASPGTGIYGEKGKADTRTSTYYLPNFNTWNHPHHNALPDMRYYSENENQKNDYELVAGLGSEGGIVRTAKDGSTEIDLGDYFKENLNIQPLLPFEGDTIVEGRFGNSVRLGGNPIGAKEKTAYSTSGNVGDPITIFRNGQLIEKEDRGWEHTLENINTDHSTMCLTSNQKLANFQPASTNWETWLVQSSRLELQDWKREEFDNITKGLEPKKIVTPETDDSNEGGSGNFDLSDYVNEPAEALTLPAGMCYNPCGDDSLSIYDDLMYQDNFDPDEFDWLEHEHIYNEEMLPVRTEADAIADADGNFGDPGKDYSNEPPATGDEATNIKLVMDVLMGLGASKHGAAAIAGNMLAESRMIVDRLETSWLNKKQSWYGGVSLVQWTGSRRTKFEKHFGIASSVSERKSIIGAGNKNVASYQGKVRNKVTFKAATEYYWDEIGSTLQTAMKNATTAEEAADAILADLRPGSYLCWRDWDKGSRKYCNKGQTTKDLATAGKNKTRNKRVKNSMKAFNTYDA